MASTWESNSVAICDRVRADGSIANLTVFDLRVLRSSQIAAFCTRLLCCQPTALKWLHHFCSRRWSDLVKSFFGDSGSQPIPAATAAKTIIAAITVTKSGFETDRPSGADIRRCALSWMARSRFKRKPDFKLPTW